MAQPLLSVTSSFFNQRVNVIHQC